MQFHSTECDDLPGFLRNQNQRQRIPKNERYVFVHNLSEDIKAASSTQAQRRYNSRYNLKATKRFAQYFLENGRNIWKIILKNSNMYEQQQYNKTNSYSWIVLKNR